MLTDGLTRSGSRSEAAGKFAVIGVGVTDFSADYRAARAGGPEYIPPDAQTLARLAFERALADSGLSHEDVDGVCASFPYGGPAPASFARTIGIEARHLMPGGGMMPFQTALEALSAGVCGTMAIVHSLPSRAIGRDYGGRTYGGDGRDSYYYYHPWGFSSQAAHWAMMSTYYSASYGATEADFGEVAVAVRSHAARNPNAIMRTPMTIDDYLAARYIVRPIRLFDLCLVNDGAVCVILTDRNRARDSPHDPVLVAGWGSAYVQHSKMDEMLREGLRPQLAAAGTEALGMAGLAVADVDHFEGYDASTIHLVNQLEGYGFAERGEGAEFWKSGRASLGGSLPTNTGGGMLSEAYLQGWNLIAEVVHQLRHEAGDRQVNDAEVSLFSFATTESAHPIVFVRGR